MHRLLQKPENYHRQDVTTGHIGSRITDYGKISGLSKANYSPDIPAQIPGQGIESIFSPRYIFG